MTHEEQAARIEALERMVRRLMAVGCAAVVIIAGAVVMGQASAPPKVIQAQRFEIIDKDGVKRGFVGMLRSGSSVGLELNDAKETPRATFVVNGEDGTPEILLRAEHMQVLVYIGADSSDNSLVRLGRVRGGETVSLRMLDRGGAQIAVSDDSGTPRAVVGTQTVVQKDGTDMRTAPSTLTLSGADGKIIERIPK